MVSIQTILLGAFALAQTASADQQPVNETTAVPTTVGVSNCAFQDGDVIALQEDSGYYATRCHNCIPYARNIDSVTLKYALDDGTQDAFWTVTNTGDGKIALKGDSYYYLSRCHDCTRGGVYPDQAFAFISDWIIAPWAQFTCEDAYNGKIALKADTGKCLARCRGCVPSGRDDVITMHVDEWSAGDYAQFTVVKKPAAANN
ncbi:unnamed protein product [Aphanomyces euteiches]|uniref:Ricin B lectin domain-containing protein n=1 Tax=Aphanomyces euteiches TaxID=100861 RepID=A0A6G0X373_9STRA|nr:hypothetical protein Ae201684_008962 [Aphanomyces euteiches]KAH9054347.1 hypothetical protein Ae201684P_018068 [Aphanomyces euteiches]KAH9054446.1 hypothetical protein Ae201684P_018166 [Aphanomyces euteiches]